MTNTALGQLGFNEVDEFIDKLPPKTRSLVTGAVRLEMTNMLNSEVGDAYRELMMVNTDLMSKYGASPEKYARAVKFCAYLNMGKLVYEAFALSHPEKYQEYKAEGKPLSELRNKLSLKGSNYKSTQLVSYLLARSAMPIAIGNLHHRQTAIDKLVQLMDSASSERVQMESADKLLTHLGFDLNTFVPKEEEKLGSDGIISKLANALDNMVSMHQREKEINPMQHNSHIIDGMVSKLAQANTVDIDEDD